MAAGMDTNFGFKRPQGESSSSDDSVADNKIQDTAKSDYRIFVGNLPNKITWQQLKSFFTKFGEVVYVKVFIDHIKRRPKGYGFVQFSAIESVQKALKAHPGELKFLGRKLRVQLPDAHFQRRTMKMSDLHLVVNLQDLEITEEAYAVYPESPISILNDDSLIYILKYLAPIERISVERVCKRWQKCAMVAMRQEKHLKLLRQHVKSFGGFTDSYLYKILYRSSCCLTSLDISCVSSQLDNKTLEIIARSCTNIEKLNMAGVFANNRGIEELTRRCTNIRWLSVFACWNISEKGFWYIFKNCPKIEYLDCTGNAAFTGRCLLYAGKSFKSLIASDCQRLINDGLIHVARNCPQMESLNVSECSLLTYQTIKDLVKSLPCLKEIRIGNLPCYDDKQEPRQNVVQHFVTPGIITKLELFNCALNDSNLQLICETCPLLLDLDISLNKLTDVSVTQISALKHLEYLSACHLYAITDGSLLGVAIQGKLRRLRVQFCKGLTDQLMQVVAKRCANIEEVDVAGVPSITMKTLLDFQRRSVQQASGSEVVIYTAYNDIDEEKVSQIPTPLTLLRINSYRPLYPVKLQVEVELGTEEFWLHAQNFQLGHAVLNDGLLPNLEMGGWRLCQDLIGSDEDSDDFEDYLAYDYLDNDDPLAEEYWNLS